MSHKEILITELTPVLNQQKYKKNKQTWYKDKGELFIVFNIQNSHWNIDDYYINLGVFIKALEEDRNITLSKCHIIERVDPIVNGVYLHSGQVLKIIDLFEEWYGTKDKLKEKALTNKLPLQTSIRAISFLTTI